MKIYLKNHILGLRNSIQLHPQQFPTRHHDTSAFIGDRSYPTFGIEDDQSSFPFPLLHHTSPSIHSFCIFFQPHPHSPGTLSLSHTHTHSTFSFSNFWIRLFTFTIRGNQGCSEGGVGETEVGFERRESGQFGCCKGQIRNFPELRVPNRIRHW